MQSKPKPPVEDPAITAARVSAQNQAEAFQTKATQGQLTADTMAIRRRFGAFGGVPTSIVPTAFNTGPGGTAMGGVIAPGSGGVGVTSFNPQPTGSGFSFANTPLGIGQLIY